MSDLNESPPPELRMDHAIQQQLITAARVERGAAAAWAIRIDNGAVPWSQLVETSPDLAESYRVLARAVISSVIEGRPRVCPLCGGDCFVPATNYEKVRAPDATGPSHEPLETCSQEADRG